MTSHQVAIAKASFSAGLLRPDPTSVSRDEITYFHSALDKALSHCSPANIQTCKSWLLRNVVPSTNRIGVLGKYISTLSGSLEDGDNKGANNTGRRGTSSKRKRLHVLYLLNDLLHHTKYHERTTSAFSTLSGSLQPYLVELVSLAASYNREKYPKHHRRLSELLDIWEDSGYYANDYINKLRETVENSASPNAVASRSTEEHVVSDTAKKVPTKEAPFIMPATHGDPNAPYHELPAGNFMPHIIPNSAVPIRSDIVKPLQFLAGPADESLVTAVKKFLKDVDLIYSTNGGYDDENGVDIDELGQAVTRDEVTGEIMDGEAYYGWSRSFCQKMKKRREGKPTSRSPSRSRSRSYSPRKRRRYSASRSDDSRGRSRSRSSSISRSRPRYISYSRSPTASRSPSPRRRRSPSRSRSYSPRPSSPPRFQQQQHQPYSQNSAAPPPPPAATQYPYNGTQKFSPPQHPTPGNMFIPPRPPNYHGPWPPPPPPAPQHGGGQPFPPGMNMGMGMNMNIPGFAPPPFANAPGGPQFVPPPPPPPPGGSQQLHPSGHHYPPPHSGQGRGYPYQGGGSQGGRGGGWGRGGWR